MNHMDKPVKCSVEGCDDAASITRPLPLCALDVLRVAAAHQRAVDPETRMTRIMALTEVHASPLASDAELAARTGWPMEWVRSHR
jgi:hypothetical protein